jgi:HPt (histidine-containing phosphotransfer) domain-containing protein
MLSRFSDGLAARQIALEQALVEEDHLELSRLAHQLGGTARILDQSRLAEVLEQLVQAADTQTLSVHELVDELGQAIKDTEKNVAALIRHLGGKH